MLDGIDPCLCAAGLHLTLEIVESADPEGFIALMIIIMLGMHLYAQVNNYTLRRLL